MKIELRELSVDDGDDILDMLREIGPGENGFGNSAYNMDAGEFPQYLQDRVKMSRGIEIDLTRWVPQTDYWLIIDDRPVGVGKLRHYLTDKLRAHGGHIGYSIRPTERGRGYGNIILAELLKKAAEKGIREVLLTCRVDNVPSRRMIERNGGYLEDIVGDTCRYWISLNNKPVHTNE